MWGISETADFALMLRLGLLAHILFGSAINLRCSLPEAKLLSLF
jgi:hypothetical protein